MKYKHIIWDWNGTLLDDCDLCLQSFNISLKKRDLSQITKKKYRESFTFPVSEVYEKVGFNFVLEPYEVVSNEFVNFYEEHFYKVKLHTRDEECLSKVLSNQVSQSILSAGKQDLLDNWIKRYNLQSYFSNIFGVEDQYALGKIKQGISLKKILPYNDHEIVLVGDTKHDSEVAESMNIDCVLVDHGHVNKKRLKSTGRFVASSLNEVLKIINL